MTTSSLGGARCLLTFIDDFSYLLWVYIIHSEDEVFNKFKEQNHCGKLKRAYVAKCGIIVIKEKTREALQIVESL